MNDDVTARRPRGRRARRRLMAVVMVSALPLLLTGCVKQGITDKAVEVNNLFYVILWLALPVFVFVEGMLLLSIVRFRKRRGDDTSPPQTPGGRAALSAFFAGPFAIVIVLLLFGETAVSRVDRDDPHPAEQLVLTGFQWEWSARYVNEHVTVTGKTDKTALTMELPVDVTTHVELRSTDVMHEFYVPDLLFMKNAIPGHPNTFTITPTTTGTYHGQCAQFCGLYHSKMTLTVKVVPLPEFQRWVAQVAAQSQPGNGNCSPSASSATLVASQVSWDKDCIAVTVGAAFQLTINNKDAGIAHNFAVYTNSDLDKRLYLSADVTGVATRTFTVPALPPGKYYFQCDIHGPAMAGTLVVR